MLQAVTCAGDPAAIAPPVKGVDWPDLVLAAIVLLVGIGAVVYWRGRRRLNLTPYATGAGLGLLFAASLVGLGRPVGISGAFQQLAGGRGVTWQVMVVAGVFVGAFVSSTLAGRWRVCAAPAGKSPVGRWITVFLLAVVLEFSAAIAGGCTSGLALSGGLVLSPGAFIFMAAMFAAGVPVARWRRP